MNLDIGLLLFEFLFSSAIIVAWIYIVSIVEISYKHLNGHLITKKTTFLTLNRFLLSQFFLMVTQERSFHFRESLTANWFGPRLLFLFSLIIFPVLPIIPDFVNRENYFFYHDYDYGILWVCLYLIVASFLIRLVDFGSRDRQIVYNGISRLPEVLYHFFPIFIIFTSIIVNAQSGSLEQIVNGQQAFSEVKSGSWGIIRHPLGALAFLLYGLYFTESFLINPRKQGVFKAFEDCLTGTDKLFYVGSIKIYTAIWMVLFILLYLGGTSSFPGLEYLKQINWMFYKGVMLVLFLLKFVILFCLFCVIRWFFYSYKSGYFPAKIWKITLPLAIMDLLISMVVVFNRY